jgi:hypothetical protein
MLILMSVPAPAPSSPVPAPTTAPSPVAAAWGPKAASVIGPFTIKSSTGKYMYFNTVDQQAIATTWDVSMSDTPQLFLFGSSIPDIQKFPTNVGIPIRGPLFPAYVQLDGSLWSYASSGYNTTTGANTTGEKHMINAPFTQTATNWSTPYHQSFAWNFWANSDGTYKIQNEVAGYASPSSDGTKVLLGVSANEKWTIDYVSYPSPPTTDAPTTDAPTTDAPAPSPEIDNSLWIWIGAGVGILFLFIILIVVITKKSRTRGK